MAFKVLGLIAVIGLLITQSCTKTPTEPRSMEKANGACGVGSCVGHSGGYPR